MPGLTYLEMSLAGSSSSVVTFRLLVDPVFLLRCFCLATFPGDDTLDMSGGWRNVMTSLFNSVQHKTRNHSKAPAIGDQKSSPADISGVGPSWWEESEITESA